MNVFKTKVFPVLAATIWISISEFLRNQILFPSYWEAHFQAMGLTFPASPANGAIWGLWSLVFAGVMFVISRKFTWIETGFLGWVLGFVLMWLVIGNLGVLPFALLKFAIPLSLIEAFLASYILCLWKQEDQQRKGFSSLIRK